MKLPETDESSLNFIYVSIDCVCVHMHMNVHDMFMEVIEEHTEIISFLALPGH